MQTSRSWGPLLLLLLGLSVTGCGLHDTPSQPNGKPASVNLSLRTVPTVRSITVSPGKASFSDCHGGKTELNTVSGGNRLGFPNATCWVGEVSPIGVYPITITNTGIASFVFINGSAASPSDGGNQWTLCNLGPHPLTACNGWRNRVPGVDQYVIQNFGTANKLDRTGLSGTPQCDREFGDGYKCWATLGASQTEGFKLTGPYKASDEVSTKYTMTITWTPVPAEGQS
jgi:hypothetical protein